MHVAGQFELPFGSGAHGVARPSRLLKYTSERRVRARGLQDFARNRRSASCGAEGVAGGACGVWFIELAAVPGWELAFPERQFLNEFPIRVPKPAVVNRKLARKGILGGLDMHRWFRELNGVFTFTCTEVNDPRAIDELVEAVSS